MIPILIAETTRRIGLLTVDHRNPTNHASAVVVSRSCNLFRQEALNICNDIP